MELAVDHVLVVADAWPRPLTAPLRVAHLRELDVLLGPLPDGLAPWPALVAAAHALVHRVPRVVLATPALARALEAPLTLWLASLGVLVIDPARPHVLVPLDADASADQVAVLRAERVVPLAGTGRWVMPERATPVTLSAAALALPLHAARVRELLPTVTLDPVTPIAGAETLALHLGRVVLAAGHKPLGRPPAPPTPTTDPLALALQRLIDEHAFVRTPGPAGLLSLKREAERILREQVRHKRIVSFVVDVREDDGEPLIEAFITHHKRVGKVVLRIAPTPGSHGE